MVILYGRVLVRARVWIIYWIWWDIRIPANIYYLSIAFIGYLFIHTPDRPIHASTATAP